MGFQDLSSYVPQQPRTNVIGSSTVAYSSATSYVTMLNVTGKGRLIQAAGTYTGTGGSTYLRVTIDGVAYAGSVAAGGGNVEFVPVYFDGSGNFKQVIGTTGAIPLAMLSFTKSLKIEMYTTNTSGNIIGGWSYDIEQ